MGIKSRTRTFGSLSSGAAINAVNPSFDSMLRTALSGNIPEDALSSAAFLGGAEYGEMVSLLGRNSTTFLRDQQQEIAQLLKEGISGLDAFHDVVAGYAGLLRSLQGKFLRNQGYALSPREALEKENFEQRIARLCDEYLNNSTAAEDLSAMECYDLSEVMELYTDFDNLKTVTEGLDDSVKFANQSVLGLLDDSNQRLEMARDLLKSYLTMSQDALSNGASRPVLENEIGYRDEQSGRVYINTDRVLSELGATSLAALLKLPEGNRIKGELYRLIDGALSAN
jgi:hypothetical protein